MTEWRTTTVAELASTEKYSVVGGPFGSALGRKHYVDSGVPVIRGVQLGGPGDFDESDLVFVTEEKADKHAGNLAYRGDIIVTQRGTVGQIGRIPATSKYDRYLLSQSQMKITVDLDRCDERFLMYVLRSPGAQHDLVAATISSGVPHINLGTLRGLTVNVPSLSTQRRIVSVLGSIDDLIENNRRRIEILEEMAQAFYREWFVHFRFPGHETATFVDSPLGPIPEDWTGASFSDLVTLVKETVSPEAIEQGAPVVGLEHIPREQLTLDDWEEAAEVGSRRGMFRRGDILFGKIRPYFHKVSVAPFDGYCSTDAMVFRPTGNLGALAASVAFSKAFVDVATATSNGTKMPRANWEVLSAYPVAVPSVALLERFNDLFSHSVEQCRALMLSNKVLAATRDRLLPKLVSGEIDVSDLDLDAVLEGAV